MRQKKSFPSSWILKCFSKRQSEGLSYVTRSWKGVNQERQAWQEHQHRTQPECPAVPEEGTGLQETHPALLPGRGEWRGRGRHCPAVRCPQLLLSRFLLQDLSYLLTLGVCPQSGERHSPSAIWPLLWARTCWGCEKTWDAHRSLMNRVQFISWMMVAVLLKRDNSVISTQPWFKYHMRPITDLQQSRWQKLGLNLSPRPSFPLCNFTQSLQCVWASVSSFLTVNDKTWKAYLTRVFTNILEVAWDWNPTPLSVAFKIRSLSSHFEIHMTSFLVPQLLPIQPQTLWRCFYTTCKLSRHPQV